YNPQLLVLEVLISELYYGRHVCEWWIPIADTNLVSTGLFSLRIEQKIAVELNKRQFIMQIIQENSISKYCCKSQEISGLVKNSATNAVSKLYQSIFHIASKFSVWQTIDEDGCHIEIYYNNELFNEFHNKTPNIVWKNANFLINTDGIGLFGLHSKMTQDQLNKMHNLKCLPKDWKDKTQIAKLYNYHLHKYTILVTNWY
ncbi:34371_t:CDS:2, partial [Gigaspora margarita]